MQNLVRFQTVTDSNGTFALKLEEKMKNKETFIGAEEISFCEN